MIKARRFICAGLCLLGIVVVSSTLINGCKEGYHAGGHGFSDIDGHSFHWRCRDYRIWHAIIYDCSLTFESGRGPNFVGGDSFAGQLENGNSIAMEYLNDQTIKIDGKEFELGKGSVFLVSLRDAESRHEQLPIRFERIDMRKINGGNYNEYIENQLREFAKEHPRLKQFLDAPPARQWQPKKR